MARRKQTRGLCTYCGREMTRSGLSRHLKSCKGRVNAIQQANQGSEAAQALYHLLVQDARVGYYWLHLEMRADATLQDLDDYLRSIWLECCGHLSAFHIPPYRFTQIFEDSWSQGDEESMDIEVSRVLMPGMSIPYEYDFGTTSQLKIKVVDQRPGKPTTPHPIALMARNTQPEIICMECDEEATYLCMQCVYHEGGELCDEHSESHECGEDYQLPLVNSPRTGMCGYCGPAEAPY